MTNFEFGVEKRSKIEEKTLIGFLVIKRNSSVYVFLCLNTVGSLPKQKRLRPLCYAKSFLLTKLCHAEENSKFMKYVYLSCGR